MTDFPPPGDRDPFPPQQAPPPPPPPQPYPQPPPQHSPYQQQQPQYPVLYAQPVAVLRPTQPKDKTGAVLLAVFLGFWTWCYTYQRDSWKFWLNLALCVLTLGFWYLVAWPWAIIDVCVKPQSWYDNFPNV
jgi:hypothetical protein